MNDTGVLPANTGGGYTPGTGISNLRRLRVEDVLIPRVEIISVSCDAGLENLVAVFRESGLTRLPVYDGTLDTPIGMVHLKDVALRYGFSPLADPCHEPATNFGLARPVSSPEPAPAVSAETDPDGHQSHRNGGDKGFSLRSLLRPLLYVPPSMPIGVLLQKMQTDRTHMALVIDEYGGVDGLVTIEDLIEQVIGEIEDEHDVEEDRPWIPEGDRTYLVRARAPLEEFEAETGVKLVEDGDEDEIDTLGGVVFMLTGRVPARGEVIPHPSGAEFEVVDADPRRIKRLRVRLPDPGQEPG